MTNEANCVVGVRTHERDLKALVVRIKGEDVYVNYFRPDGTRGAHSSYHASGQRHTKVGPDYIYWSGGPSGQWEPMKFLGPPAGAVKGRQHAAVIGWELASLANVLPQLDYPPGMLVDADTLEDSSVVGIEVNIIGKADSEPSPRSQRRSVQSTRPTGSPAFNCLSELRGVYSERVQELS